MGGGAVDDRAHRVLADAEGDVAPGVQPRELAGARRTRSWSTPRGRRRRRSSWGRGPRTPPSSSGRRRASRAARPPRSSAAPRASPRASCPPRRAPSPRPAPGAARARLSKRCLPLALRRGAGLDEAHVRVDALVDPEAALGVEAHRLLGRAHLLLAERRAVRGGGVHGVGGRVGDVRADRDERRPLGFRARRPEAPPPARRGPRSRRRAARASRRPRGAPVWFSPSKEIAVAAVDRDAVVVVAHHRACPARSGPAIEAASWLTPSIRSPSEQIA